MPDEPNSNAGYPEDRIPEVPLLAELPEAPRYTPKLPPLPKKAESAEDARRSGIAYTLPASLIAPVVVLTFAGYWLDAKFKTGQSWTLFGALLGMVCGFINMFKIANKLNK